MFPKLKGTFFENGIDAAIRSTGEDVFLFKGKKYIRINYLTRKIGHERYIRDGFPSLAGTVFEKGIDAAFASHIKDEAYIFKGEYYARINIARHTIT
ncbi:albumin-2-like, partial [Trifolium medium]|nr:albumin-2-like [Trifolium medium]